MVHNGEQKEYDETVTLAEFEHYLCMLATANFMGSSFQKKIGVPPTAVRTGWVG